jgi:long-chain fatty acid transport protein
MLLPAIAKATNGLNLIDSGGISAALAGADTAVSLDFSTINSNPAGMSQLPGTHLGLSLAVLQGTISLRNSLNDRDGENQPVVIPNTGVVHHLSGTPFTLGLGVFTMGGYIAELENLNIPRFGPGGVFGGTVDTQSAQLRHVKLTPTIAYKVTKDLSLGVSLGISYVDINLKILPNTPGMPGLAFGFETKGRCDRAYGLALPPAGCNYDVGFAPKFGAMYRLNDMITLGLVYTMQTSFTFNHGQVDKNYLGIGRVTFDSEASGFKWPQDVSAGIAIRPSQSLLVAAKFQWINWAKALNQVTVTLRHGSQPAVPSDSFELNYNWRDQYVVAIGALYDVTDHLSITGGYNFGTNPVPKATLDPTNATIIKHHFTAGASYRFSERFALGGWFTYAVKESTTYDSPLFGPRTTLEVGGFATGVTLTYAH